MKGKDGRVEIHIRYSNDSKSVADIGGEKEELFTPFTMITAMMLPADEYQNVEIDHGRVISDADKAIVIGLGFPGINENLKLADGDFDFALPEEVTITADVKNASIGPAITVASTDFLQDLDVDGMNDFDDLSDSIEDLKDATNQLAEGSKKAADGAGELSGGAGELSAGAGTLAVGAGELNNGAGTLAEGAGTLAGGVGNLANGAKEVHSGAVALKGGAGDLATGAGTLCSGAEDVANGAKEVHGGAGNL